MQSCKEGKFCYELVENSPVGMCVIKDGKFEFVNSKATEIIRLSKSEIENITSIYDFIDDEFAEKIKKIEKELLEGKRNSASFWFILKPKENCKSSCIQVYLKTLNLEERKLSCVLVDITKEKELEEQLKSKEERKMEEIEELVNTMTGIMDSSVDAVFVKDKNLKYKYVNKVFCESAAGKTDKEILGKTADEVIPFFYDGKIKEEEENLLKEAERTKKKVVSKSIREASTADGGKLYIHTVKTPIFNKKGDVIGLVGISRDYSKERREEELLEEKVREQSKLLIQRSKLAMMGETLGNIAHQWRQPLNSTFITLQNIEILLENPEKLIEKKEILLHFIKQAKENLQFLTKTIDDFRSFYKPDKEKKTFSVKEEIERSISLYKPELDYKNISINFTSFADANPMVIGYKNEFRQVIINLISNAKSVLLERQVQNPEINISLLKFPERVIIKVSDNGGGIEEKYIDKIFEPFFTTREEGTGIGLYMAKVIIERNMGGQIEVKNNKKGAEFTITLGVK